MWEFAVALFLIALSPNSFVLTASFGLTEALSVVVFGGMIGTWVDRTERMAGRPIMWTKSDLGNYKVLPCLIHYTLLAAKISLVWQNSSVALCAAGVFAILGGHVSEDSPVRTLLLVFIIVFGALARLGSVAGNVAVERTWAAKICENDSVALAGKTPISLEY